MKGELSGSRRSGGVETYGLLGEPPDFTVPVAWFCGEEPVPLYTPVGDVYGAPLLAAAGLVGAATTFGEGGVLPVVVVPVVTPLANVSLGPLTPVVVELLPEFGALSPKA